MTPISPTRYRCGDAIKHLPSGEEWLVAHCDQTHVWCCGWPYSGARLEDTEMVEAATDEAHISLLKQIAKGSNERGDNRTSVARATLASYAASRPLIADNSLIPRPLPNLPE